jgi:tetraacyldisaccharide 4'-kinase
MRAPDFWDRDDAAAKIAAAVLAPLGWLYGATVRWKAQNATPYRARVPVVCIGNISAGGTGKTPVAIAVADAIIAHGKNPFFLTRGYGGRLAGPVVVSKSHTAADVGDEPLLLARKAATVVSRDRCQGAMLAVERGADIIVMDDGHQNFTLAKDLSLVVVDGERGFGNGRVLPAGPLREPVAQGLARADAVIVTGDGSPHLPAFNLPGFEGPVLRAHVAPAAGTDWNGSRVVAFAGIGRPEKLFRTLAGLGAELIDTIAFADHHSYSNQELNHLKARADGAQLVTTEKDYLRIAESDRDGISFLPVIATIEPYGLDRLLDRLGRAR